MKRLLLLLILFSVVAHAQYTTPNNGESITLSDLLLVEPAIITLSDTDEYTLTSDLIISANDTLLIDQPTTLYINPEILVTIFGTWISSSPDAEAPILITAQDVNNPHEGFRFEEGSDSYFNLTNFEYGGGLRVLSTNFRMSNCAVKYQFAGQATASAISFSRGAPEITNSYFFQNDLPAISSGANQSVAIKFIGNTLEYNGQTNSNRPQINMSPSGANDTIVIENNIILGDRTLSNVGGIAVSNFFGSTNHVIIKNNQITDNRYGLTLVGAVDYAEVDNNIIEFNNTQGNPNLGGSGINLNASGSSISQNIYVKNNIISNNLWGITMQGTAYANLGDGTELSPGGNIFSDNGFEGVVYALYNNTPNDIFAQGNCWIAGQESTEEEVAEVITDQSDIAGLGLVDYANYGCNLSVGDIALSPSVQLYPNPAKNFIVLDVHENGHVEFYNQLGQIVHKVNLTSGKNEIQIQLNSGLYYLKITTSSKPLLKKLLIK